VKVTVTFEVSDDTSMVVARNSLERVINTTASILGEIDPAGVEDASAEELQANIEDWEICKPIAVSLWKALRDGCLRAKLDNKKQIHDWSV
jgi:hypothetical protein